MKTRRERELEETVTALQHRAAELSELRDLAYDAKVELIAAHADERKKRQTLEEELGKVHAIVTELKQIVGRYSMGSPNNEAEVNVALKAANEWTVLYRERRRA